MNRSCAHCGKSLKKRHMKKYCSRSCYYEYRRKAAEALPKEVPIEIGNGQYKYHRSSSLKGHNFTTSIYVRVPCSCCGKHLLREKGNLRRCKNHFCSRECKNEHRKSNLPDIKYKRGNGNGYILERAPNHPGAKMGFVPQHRIIVEKSIGRYLRPDELVHHINCNIQDNRIENLMVMRKGAHHKAHGSLEKCVESLMSKGIIRFDRNTLTYEVEK